MVYTIPISAHPGESAHPPSTEVKRLAYGWIGMFHIAVIAMSEHLPISTDISVNAKSDILLGPPPFSPALRLATERPHDFRGI